MADVILLRGASIPPSMRTRYRDMGDGTWALVVSSDIAPGASVDVTDVIPGVGATNLGKAEDAPHTSGDTGVLTLAVRNDSDQIMTDVDLDYSPVSTDDRARLKMVDAWLVTLVADETANDSDKTLTVPASTEYQVLWIYVELATTASAGDRQLQIDFRDAADDIVGQIRPNAVQAASLTRYYMIAPALANQTAFYDTDHIQTPMPPTIFLPSGYDVRIYDNNAIDAAADDMVVQMMVAAKST